MAHILVYAQRTPQGIHPASATALCLARDIASDRGATISAVCPGDAGRADQFVIGAVSRYGADLLAFCEPNGLRPLQDRLRPLVVFVPHTEECLAAAEGLAGGPLETTWLQDPSIEWDNLAAVTSIVAGTLPWYELPTTIDPEYDNEASLVDLPSWVARLDGQFGRGPLRYFASHDLDPTTRAQLGSLGARQVAPEYLEQHDSGRLLWLSTAPAGLPEILRQRGPGARVMYFPGADGQFSASWSAADWVIPGPWPEALKQLHSDLCKQISEKHISYDKGKSRTWESVREGIDFVWNQKALLGAMGLDIFAVLFGGAIALLPVFAKDILQLGAQAFGLLMSATYLGNFIAIFFLTKYPLINRQGYKLIYSVAGFGICIIIFALSKVFWLSFLALLL